MIQSIIDGIIAAVLEVFPGVTVYEEQVRQGLKEPCFFVQLVSPSNEHHLGNRYHRTNLFSVQYFPKSTTKEKAECNAVSEVLLQALEYIIVNGDLQRGTSMRSEYFGGVLTFFVNYNMFVRTEPKVEPMEILTINNQAERGIKDD